MARILRGNYQLAKGKEGPVFRRPKKGLTDLMEESALAKLGGSICFVMKKNTFMWSGESGEKAGSADR